MAEHLTLHEFKVQLDHLQNAATQIGLKKKWIMDCMDGVRANFTAFEEEWQTPSEVTFHDVQLWFDRSYTHLDSVLGDIIGRMWKAYDNYHRAEVANVANLAAKHRDDGSRKAHREAAVIAPKHDDHKQGGAQLRLREAMIPRTKADHDDQGDAQALLSVVLEREDGKP